MSYILALTAAGMFVHVSRVKDGMNGKRWLVAFYLGLAGWQLENVIRYSLPPAYYETTEYSLQTVFIYIPFLSLTLIAHTQYTYRYLTSCFRREQKIVLWASIGLSSILFGIVCWNERYNQGSLVVLLLSCFALGLFITVWNIVLCLRKASHLKGIDRTASKAHSQLALFNGFFVGASVCSLVFGFFSAMGFWSYFLFVWFGTLACCPS